MGESLTLVRPRSATPVAATRPGRVSIAFFALALATAAYTGFRLPGAWVATLDTVSVTDGFHRRFLIGTLLHPLAIATGYDYWVFAAASFAVLAALLVVLTVAFVRAGAEGRLVIIGWLLVPTGGFFFHDVGYYEQVLYLLLFAALWLLPRRPAVAAVLMTVAVLVHEIALLTVLPIFVVVLSQRFPLRRAALLAATPLLVELAVLAIPASAPGAVDRLRAATATANFPIRVDALALFERTQSQSWRLYSIGDVLLFVVPIAGVLLAGFLVLRGRGRPIAVVSQAAAIGAPALLAFAGWDGARWGFLLMTNFAVVLWLRKREFSVRQLIVLGATLLLLTHMPLPYFDRYHPRELSRQGVESIDQSLFRVPSV